MLLFTAAVFISSFLLFAIQPVVAKFLLPSFGGTAAVWATCLVVFQTLLLVGYSYAHLLRTKLSPKAQRLAHLGVLVVALTFLPPAPNVAANAAATPVWSLLRSLLTSIGVPFFALSATAPLLMEWFRQSFPERSPDRLYAFSNAGSLLALLAYPVLLEPMFTRIAQARLWAGGMALFLVVCGVVAWRSMRRFSVEQIKQLLSPALHADGEQVAEENQKSKIKNQKSEAEAQSLLTPAASGPRWLWVALPACGSGLLLALTNQISQDVAPMPLLWVAPLAIYLLSFILCFEGPRSYRRQLFIPACFAGFLLLAWLLDQGYLHGFAVQVGGYLAVLFLGCMVCHGELYRLRPPPEKLTAYYLAISLGGALGGIFVGLVAPTIFKTILETPIIAVAIVSLCTFVEWHRTGPPANTTTKDTKGKSPSRPTSAYSVYSAVPPKAVHPLLFGLSPSLAALLATFAVAAALIYVVFDQRKESIYYTRSFYGAYRVKQGPTLLLNQLQFPLAPGTARVLLSGQIYHGLQFTDPSAAMLPTTYYCEEGGLGLAFAALPASTNRHIGAIGLGAGTLAAYGKTGDRIRFYELNPDVLRIATNDFTFLTRTPAKVDVILGDGRLSLERESSQAFDLLVLDAFAGDSIPMHLLTDRAMAVYRRHLKPTGVMAFHISNSHLDLEPVVRALAEKHDFTAALVPAKLMDTSQGKLPSIWMLLSSNPDFFNQPAIANLSTKLPESRHPILWTDDYSSILPILH